MPEVTLLDPAFEQLLREAASDPRSTLLRKPRNAPWKRYLESEDYLRPSLPDLTRVERELVRVYRSETAWLLREAAQTLQLNGSAGRRFVLRYHGRGVERTTLAPGEVRGRAVELRSLSPKQEGAVEGALDALLNATGFEGGDERLIATFAALSMQLEPTNRARLIAAKDLINREELDGAHRLLGVVCAHTSRRVDQVRAWECAGRILGRRKRYEDALTANRHARQLGPVELNPILNCFTYALQCGKVQDAITASKDVSYVCGRESGVLLAYARALRVQRDKGDWAPTRDAVNALEAVQARCDPSGRQICNVFE